ncbi:hypothetical protein BDK51DRAFT_51401 [Blyttiomyces helicus]|uniref:RRM domain-containing protein n=1 Tax=Blyttiomyces helicus TaxID=388810 RepID=A0A4P9W5Z2_9FUNG|nr:hypothetical protein BDK51DRAFT_51401 [Blyttiomyces helicus]|eukprot:RKO87704.1 hypothetical protein BDK51DRAFT_51401 [Blyttiomyces helicus]
MSPLPSNPKPPSPPAQNQAEPQSAAQPPPPNPAPAPTPDLPISKRIFVGGLADSVTRADLEGRFTAFGKVLDVDLSGVGPAGGSRGFGYVSLETTTKTLKKCTCLVQDGLLVAGLGGFRDCVRQGYGARTSNPNPSLSHHAGLTLYNGTKWKGSLLKVEEAKQKYTVRLHREWDEIAAQAERTAPTLSKKKRKRLPAQYAEDMSLVTDTNAGTRKGWKKSRYGRAVISMNLRNQLTGKGGARLGFRKKWAVLSNVTYGLLEERPTSVTNLTWFLTEDELPKPRPVPVYTTPVEPVPTVAAVEAKPTANMARTDAQVRTPSSFSAAPMKKERGRRVVEFDDDPMDVDQGLDGGTDSDEGLFDGIDLGGGRAYESEDDEDGKVADVHGEGINADLPEFAAASSASDEGLFDGIELDGADEGDDEVEEADTSGSPTGDGDCDVRLFDGVDLGDNDDVEDLAVEADYEVKLPAADVESEEGLFDGIDLGGEEGAGSDLDAAEFLAASDGSGEGLFDGVDLRGEHDSSEAEAREELFDGDGDSSDNEAFHTGSGEGLFDGIELDSGGEVSSELDGVEPGGRKVASSKVDSAPPRPPTTSKARTTPAIAAVKKVAAPAKTAIATPVSLPMKKPAPAVKSRPVAAEKSPAAGEKQSALPAARPAKLKPAPAKISKAKVLASSKGDASMTTVAAPPKKSVPSDASLFLSSDDDEDEDAPRRAPLPPPLAPKLAQPTRPVSLPPGFSDDSDDEPVPSAVPTRRGPPQTEPKLAKERSSLLAIARSLVAGPTAKSSASGGVMSFESDDDDIDSTPAVLRLRGGGKESESEDEDSISVDGDDSSDPDDDDVDQGSKGKEKAKSKASSSSTKPGSGSTYTVNTNLRALFAQDEDEPAPFALFGSFAPDEVEEGVSAPEVTEAPLARRTDSFARVEVSEGTNVLTPALPMCFSHPAHSPGGSSQKFRNLQNRLRQLSEAEVTHQSMKQSVDPPLPHSLLERRSIYAPEQSFMRSKPEEEIRAEWEKDRQELTEEYKRKHKSAFRRKEKMKRQRRD